MPGVWSRPVDGVADGPVVEYMDQRAAFRYRSYQPVSFSLADDGEDQRGPLVAHVLRVSAPETVIGS